MWQNYNDFEVILIRKEMLEQVKKSCTLNIKSNRLMSILSFSTMALLIFASVVIITILQVTPIIILGIGQLSSGQRDVIITPRTDFLNTTRFAQLAKVPVMPRIKQFIEFKQKQVKGWFMDFKQQRQNHLGKLGGDEPFNHSYIYTHEQNGLSRGENVILKLTNKTIIEGIMFAVQTDQILYAQKDLLVEQLQKLLSNESTMIVQGSFQVKEVFDTASGKFGIGSVNNYVYLDIKFAFQQMINYTYRINNLDTLTSPLVKLINSPYFSLSHFATEATINLKDRISVYSNPNYQQTFITLNQYAQNLLQKVGIISVATELPIGRNLKGLGYLGMFIGVMFKLIICSLFLLSVLMMNNMFRMGIQRKNFDFALLKVMGAERSFIVGNILAGALKYLAFSNIVAYPLALIALKLLTNVFQDFFGYRHQIQPTIGALFGGLFIGILVPIISAISPVWSVIKNDLAQNLNPLRNKTQATKVQVYIEGKQFPTGKLAFGLIAASYGLMIYYLLPRALINENLGLLLVIFFIILQGLLLGLILLSFSVQYALEKILAYSCLFWIQATDLLLTIKNLQSHRFRNRRTALLYSFSVAFIIFVSVGLQIQLQTVYVQVLKARGSYIMISNFRGGTIDKKQYDKLLSTIPGVQDWAFATKFLQNVLKQNQNVLISDKARLNFQKSHIRGVSPNLINTFFYQKVSYYKSFVNPPYDPYSYLYSPEGSMSATLSFNHAKQLGLLDSNQRQFYVNIYENDSMRKIALNYSTIFDKRMGLMYSVLPVWQELGVSFDTFRILANIPSDQDIPFNELKVKVSDINQVKQIAQEIRRKKPGVENVWDYTEFKATIDQIDHILSIVTYILLVIALAISFFSLLTTNYVNIVSQTNEIAILLILGYEKERIVRVYIYQSFIMVLNSCIIGLVVGSLTALLLGMQRQIFAQLPISIQIRGVPALFAASIISSLVSTYHPFREIFSLTVSQILNYSS